MQDADPDEAPTSDPQVKRPPRTSPGLPTGAGVRNQATARRAPSAAMPAAPSSPAEKPSVRATASPIWSAPKAAATAVIAARPSARADLVVGVDDAGGEAALLGGRRRTAPVRARG